MATMIPDDIERFTTDGERQFYQFLHAVAKPDSQFVTWYTPDIEGKEPDFILFCNKTGLIIFEVKDWSLDQITHADPKKFRLIIESKTTTRENPLHQAKGYFIKVMEKLKKDGKLLSQDPFFLGKVKIPISYGVIFPNINKFNYEQKGLDKIIETDKIFFNDELHPQSDIYSDPSGKRFYEVLEQKFPPRFSCNLSRSELNHLRQLLFPEIKLDLPTRDSNFEDHQKKIGHLDWNQEVLARKYDGGHRIIKGPSGSGKTIVLVHKAAMLQKYNPQIKTILFVCFNITLVDFLKRLLVKQRVRLGIGRVEVYHFYQLCSKIMGEGVQYNETESEYYDMVVTEALVKNNAKNIQYDAILVDEGQDLSDDMYKLVISLLNPATNSLTIALDDNQNIYRRTQTWKELGVKARGRTHSLTYVYRNTKEIANLAVNFIGKDDTGSHERKSKQLSLFSDSCHYNGPNPVIKQFSSYGEIVSFMRNKILDFQDHKKCPLSEIAVGYTKSSLPDTPDISLPQLIMEDFDKYGVFANWVSKNLKAKERYDITSDKVTISTIHSIKGLDYACLFLLGLDALDGSRWTEEQIIRLIYVAMTRARYWLFIPYIKSNWVIEKILKATQ